MVIFSKPLKEEAGQAMVIFAVAIVLLCVIAAFTIDLGAAYLTKTHLQTAADAAALAGAQDLPDASTAISTAKNYAELNGAELAKTAVTTPYGGDARKIEVVCTEKVEYTFARVIGVNEKNISARAVSVNPTWANDALPFINLDGQAEDSTEGSMLDAWDKVYPGDKERISNDDLIVDSDSIKVILSDSNVIFKKGKVMSEVKTPLMTILVEGNTVYIISIKHSEMANYEKKGSKELKNNDAIPCSDTVLLECEVVDGFSGTGSDKIELKFIASYNWDASTKTYLSDEGEAPGGQTKLVE